jgi:hypothetical protein
VGQTSLRYNTTGSYNTAAGVSALKNSTGSFNTAIGSGAGLQWTTGTHNIAVGYGTSGAPAESGTTRIGGGNWQTKVFIEGIRGATGATPFDQAVCTNGSDQLGPCDLEPLPEFSVGGTDSAHLISRLLKQIEEQRAELAVLRATVEALGKQGRSQ